MNLVVNVLILRSVAIGAPAMRLWFPTTESIGNYLWLCEALLDVRAETGAQLLGSCANWLLCRGNSRPQYVGDAPWRSAHTQTARCTRTNQPDRIGLVQRLGERAIDDEVGSGAPAVGRPRDRDEHDAATFSGTPIRPVGFKAIVDLKASGALRSMLCQTPPWNKYFAAIRQ
jgi:hypothetical protein